MIIARSPFRITLGGGGTDLPSYYRNYGGFLVSAAIDKYVYITLYHPFEETINLKYSKMERVMAINDIQHPIIREALNLMYQDSIPHLELVSFADIPSGTGLGSSGSFTTALLKGLYTYRNTVVDRETLAEQACHIEIDLLKEPVGKQDQYIAAYGGITCFSFVQNDKVEAWSLKLSEETLFNLEDNLLLFFTGYSRSASSILREQDEKSKDSDEEMIANLHFVKDLGLRSKQALESGNLVQFGELMLEHWEYKKQRSSNMSNDQVNEWYEIALKNGAVGGKVVGAGGGGFLMFYAHDNTKLRAAMRAAGLRELRFRFDFEGTKVVLQ
jgi:D-glycero-alpha-D-manno-heptose-7-phosphate kinase